ncbi:MAG: hypothetical protein BGN86_15550 [Caulobacterales bacterium 68-7]|nr:MAG: hypothetical protein BGN86_15550 [Caulobacterales bacterium 68-7]
MHIVVPLHGLPHILIDRPRRFGRRHQDEAPRGRQGELDLSARLRVGDPDRMTARDWRIDRGVGVQAF